MWPYRGRYKVPGYVTRVQIINYNTSLSYFCWRVYSSFNMWRHIITCKWYVYYTVIGHEGAHTTCNWWPWLGLIITSWNRHVLPNRQFKSLVLILPLLRPDRLGAYYRTYMASSAENKSFCEVLKYVITTRPHCPKLMKFMNLLPK